MANARPDIVIKTGFGSIDAKGFFRESTVFKGREIWRHVDNVEERCTGGVVIITGTCIPQTKLSNKPHKITLEVDPATRRLMTGHCGPGTQGCPAGADGQCKHTAALVHYINFERTEACTDVPKTWKDPGGHVGALYPKGKTIEELYLGTHTEQMPEQPSEDSLQELADELAACGLSAENCGLYKMLTVDTSVVTDMETEPIPINAEVEKMFAEDEQPPPTYSPAAAASATTRAAASATTRAFDHLSIEGDLSDLADVLDVELEEESTDDDDDDDEAVGGDDKDDAALTAYYRKKVEVDDAQRTEIFRKTIGQATGQTEARLEWQDQRKPRISASMAHKIWRGRKKVTRCKYFVGTSIKTSGMIYGQEMEATARRVYEEITGLSVIECGLVVSKNFPWLCGSPDGITVDGHGQRILLEIKCPSSNKNSKIDVDYIRDGKLKVMSDYYAQVQINMYLCKCDMAHLFVYSDADHVKIDVKMDKEHL